MKMKCDYCNCELNSDSETFNVLPPDDNTCIDGFCQKVCGRCFNLFKSYETPIKKVFVSGCFDLLHCKHIAFLDAAAKYGQLYVSVGSDNTVKDLKGHPCVYSQEERVYMVGALKCVHKAFIGSGSGKMDFLNEFYKVKPHYFVVNPDGSSEEKRLLCEKYGVSYIVLSGVFYDGLPERRTSLIRLELTKE